MQGLRQRIGGMLLAGAAALALLPASCSDPDRVDDGHWELVPLPIHAMVLPGHVDEGDSVRIRFVWEGGGCRRSVDSVEVNRSPGTVDLTAWGLDCIGCACTEELFWDVAGVTLSPLPPGVHRIRMYAGSWVPCDTTVECSIADTLTIPSAGSPGRFSFDVLTISCVDGDPYAPAEVLVYFQEAGVDTALTGITDAAGRCRLEYEDTDHDTLTYRLWVTPGLRMPWQPCVRGEPERLVVSVWCVAVPDVTPGEPRRTGAVVGP